MEFSTVLTIGGIGLTISLLETLLESMEKPVYATTIRILALGAFAIYAVDLFGDVLKEMEGFINQWELE